MLKKAFCIVLTVLMLAASVTVAGASTQNMHMDVVLLFDMSQSMIKNDPYKIAVEGVKLFVDMMEHKGSRVGVVGFNGDIAFKIPLTEINSFQDKANFLAQMGNISYSGYTDIGRALKEAEKMLYSQGGKGNRPVMVLFTDGYIDVEKRTGRTAEESRNEVDQVLLGAQNRYPIYTIGLNSGDEVDEELLQEVAGETGAKCHLKVNPGDLPEIYSAIFADSIKSDVTYIGSVRMDGQNYNHIDINIPNDSILEANIIMLSSNRLIDAKLTDPSGNQAEFGKDVYFSKSGAYSMIKIINPAKGPWMLSLLGEKGSEVIINLIYNYDISLEASLSGTDFYKNDTAVVTARLMKDNAPLHDPELIASFNAKLEVYDDSGKLIQEMPMKLNGDEFTAELKLPDYEGTLGLLVKAAGSGFYRDSNEVSINIVNRPPELIKDLKAKLFVHFPIGLSSLSIDAASFFSDPDADALSFRIKTDGKPLAITENGSEFTLKPRNIFAFGDTRITVYCTDTSGAEVSGTFTVTSLPLMVAFIVLIIFAALFVLRRYLTLMRTPLKGTMKCTVRKEGRAGRPCRTQLSALKGIVSAAQCVDDADRHLMPELEKITFIQARGRYTLEFTNRSSYDAFVSFLKQPMKFTLDQGGEAIIKNESDNTEVFIRYENN